MSDWGGPNEPSPAPKKRGRWGCMLFVLLALLLGLVVVTAVFVGVGTDWDRGGGGTDWDGPRTPPE